MLFRDSFHTICTGRGVIQIKLIRKWRNGLT
jgi:hypothetical protein